MTEPTPDLPTAAEAEAAFKQSMAFNAEAARSGLFAAALDIADTLKEANVPNGEAALLTGAAEMVAQLWQQVGEKAGIPSAKVRKTLLDEIKTFYGKHQRASRDAVDVVAS